MEPEAVMPAYTSIIVTYNSENEIGGLLEDLTTGRNPQPVIVVDNASQDATVQLIQQYLSAGPTGRKQGGYRLCLRSQPGFPTVQQ